MWLLSLSLSLTPLAVLGAQQRTRGASRLALMGVSLAIAIASTRTSSLLLERTHDAAWLVVALVMLDLVLPGETRTLVRYGVLGGFGSAAILGAALMRQGLLPEPTFDVVIVAAILVTAALHQIVLVARGHVIEGALSGIAIVTLAVGLAYSWLGPFDSLLACVVEFAVASLLWLGHLAWIDPRWRSLRRIGVPAVIASAVCFGMALAFVRDASIERWQLGVFALGSGILWWATFSLVRRFSGRAVWSTSGRLVDGAEAARRNLAPGATLQDLAAGVLAPLTSALGAGTRLPELYTVDPPLRIRLEAGERATIRSADAPDAITRAILVDDQPGVLDLIRLRDRVVREPSVRALVDAMDHRAMGCVLPCMHLDHIEGLLLLPLGDRSEALSRIEIEEIGRLGKVVGGALVSALAERRANTHIHELSALRREAEDQISVLEGELDQLRQQCDVLGRGVSEDQTLHVAYSQSMRRVQTRAIELAPAAEPVLLIAPAGSSVLPLSRFIHERGPRWEAPFIVADCSTAPTDQVMSLLFGSVSEYRRGWFQSAAGGTLLLRDLPALPKPAQARLGMALTEQGAPPDQRQPQPLRPRIIATSRAPLCELKQRRMIDPGLARCFGRSDLRIPALRDRREDLPSLALLAIDRSCRILARDPIGIDQEAMAALIAHDWPGDVAELELVIELAVAKASTKTVTLRDLPPLVWSGNDEDESLSGTYLEVECRLLQRALLRSGGNKSEAARMLGLKRTTFLDKLRRHGLEHGAHPEVGGTATG